MEETIGYEALFSAEEWDGFETGDWFMTPEEDGAGPSDDGGVVKHTVSVVVVDDGYELSCDQGDFFDHVCDVREAANLKRFHEEFDAVLVAKLSLDR